MERTPWEETKRIPLRLLPYWRALQGTLGKPTAVALAGGRWRNADLADVIGHTFDSAKMRELARSYRDDIEIEHHSMPHGGVGYVTYRLRKSADPGRPATTPAADNATLF